GRQQDSGLQGSRRGGGGERRVPEARGAPRSGERHGDGPGR
ncbi:MAG: Threonine dehydrogenase and related Zn-dependent dehydrogenases, partial [uncultured Rubrobacteraceae bacterium]